MTGHTDSGRYTSTLLNLHAASGGCLDTHAVVCGCYKIRFRCGQLWMLVGCKPLWMHHLGRQTPHPFLKPRTLYNPIKGNENRYGAQPYVVCGSPP